MNSIIPIRLLSLAFLCVSIPMRGQGHIGKFTEMSSGNTVLVKYSEQGCFGYTSHHLLFRFGLNPEVLISERAPILSQKEKKWIDRKGPINNIPIKLLPADLIGLDKLIELYRPAPAEPGLSVAHFSTTTETIDLIQMKNGVVVARERFIDSTGIAHRDSALTELVTFSDLIQRLAKK
ncbi:hypothetical protein [Geothrix limicola]|uniref:hypothetical protein n=1 Tax=Geothrix limicola TaxID=2927978 RepID=UPI0025542765|nr:hypothetical protein [Geothrix limicola]